ncbi:CocE/NonD family hydrolase [Sinorhizobium meliloti]|nr:CocE/NonD family hydrolase [Sinorhizobium meliloti]WKL28461.1 CocE/NonD family hydrolase [Sinorhizobium meliloti]
MGEHTFTVIENEWIPLADGSRLAARIWLPTSTDTGVPAVLEFHPYRKRPEYRRDEAMFPSFAKAGIAGLHVDIRGSGESDGVMDGEYTPFELASAVEIIAWIAAQPWCNGNVGMMGLSWSGFNALQVAAIKPPALKAVISVASSVDRYNDDIHYKNGVHLSDQISWAATMLSIMSQAPDPAIIGERWRAMWLERLEKEPFFIRDWLSNQRRNQFWRHASICENFEEFSVPALVIAGWYDGYRNTPFKAVDGIRGEVKAMVGPWVHEWPHLAHPTPRADFVSEAIAWWNHWLRGDQKATFPQPQFRAFILDGARPGPEFDRAPGYWIAKDRWEPPEVRVFTLDTSCKLTTAAREKPSERVHLRSPLDTGTAGGHWYITNAGLEYPGDQRIDDGGSLIYESDALNEELVLLGTPSLQLLLASNAPLANIAVRLLDVFPDGTEARIAFGLLNLAHRNCNDAPALMTPGDDEVVTVSLDSCGYRIAPGHKIRLALSTAYWPMMLPPPYDATLSISLSSLRVTVPLLGEHKRIDVLEPQNPEPAAVSETIVVGESGRRVERDLNNGLTHYRKFSKGGRRRNLAHGLVDGGDSEDIWSIKAGDPLSATAVCRRTAVLKREGWETQTDSVSYLSCTKDEWIISEEIEAFHNGEKVFSRQRSERIPRDFM